MVVKPPKLKNKPAPLLVLKIELGGFSARKIDKNRSYMVV
jgi:hypothetical protein